VGTKDVPFCSAGAPYNINDEPSRVGTLYSAHAGYNIDTKY